MLMSRLRVIFASALACLAGAPLSAQSVRWEPGAGQLGFNQVSEVSLVFEECEPDGAPQLPTVDGLAIGRPSQRSETSMVNFNVTRRFWLAYPMRPLHRTPITIPAFTVKTDKGDVRVPAANFTVGEATVGSSGLSVADISTVTLATPKKTYWAGEVFPVTYTLSVLTRYFHSPATLVQWQPAPLVAEEWSKPEAGETMVRGERRLVATQATRAYAKDAGALRLNGAQQVVNLQVGTQGFGLFTTPAVEQRMLTTEPLELTIRPLPAAPAGFTGAVGTFTLTSKVVPTTPTVGEPVTWTLELAGTGNWPDIAGLPEREVSADFSVVQPKSKRTMKDNALFEGTLGEDVVLVPNKAGRYTLGPVKFTYFDPSSGTYRTLSTEPVTLEVGAGTAAPAPAVAPGGPVQFSLTPGGPATAAPLPIAREAVAPVPPENLPRDPLPSGQSGATPRSIGTLVWTCIALATAVPLLAWLTLAALRSRALDPERRRRAARTALVETLAALRKSAAAPRETSLHLRAWQQHTAELWEVPHAAPGAALVQAAVNRRQPGAASAWQTLWQEADRVQHGREVTLPTDWLLRAEGALQAVQVPGWRVTALFARAHLFPTAASVRRTATATLVLLAFCLLPLSARGAETPLQAYNRGDHAAAEKGWRAEVKTAPDDWAARHNLGLALAQQDRWAEATGHWASAFLLHPRSDVTRWDLALGLQRSGLAPAELVEFSRGQGRHGIARAASPGEWQLVLVACALLLGVAVALLLVRGYGRIGSWAKPTALACVIVAIVAAGAATLSLHTYGQLADANAVMVWRASTLRSLPTDADTQKVSALSAGSLAVVDRTFALGWSRLTFRGGQTGWVRNEDLVPLYR